MLTASRLHIGTRFIVSGQSGVYNKISNDGDSIKAAVVFGSSPDEVGRIDTIAGDLPCYIIPTEKDISAKKQKISKPVKKQKKYDAISENIMISVVHHDKGVILANEHPTPAEITAFSNCDTIKISSGDNEGVYTVIDVALEAQENHLFIAVE